MRRWKHRCVQDPLVDTCLSNKHVSTSVNTMLRVPDEPPEQKKNDVFRTHNELLELRGPGQDQDQARTRPGPGQDQAKTRTKTRTRTVVN
ncbi:uncharacterized protein V6R79_025075 [Siganus canaliculatus]